MREKERKKLPANAIESERDEETFGKSQVVDSSSLLAIRAQLSNCSDRNKNSSVAQSNHDRRQNDADNGERGNVALLVAIDDASQYFVV